MLVALPGGTMPVGSAATMTTSATSTAAGSITNYADVSGDQFVPTPEDNTAYAVLTVRPVLPPTGSRTLALVVAAFGSCAAGGVLVLSARKRRSLVASLTRAQGDMVAMTDEVTPSCVRTPHPVARQTVEWTAPSI